MNINTTGITIDGKTYRNLPEQVAYNTNQIAEHTVQIAELIAGSGGGGGEGGSLPTFEFTISTWTPTQGGYYYYGVLPSQIKQDRKYLMVAPLNDDTGTLNACHYVISGLNYFPAPTDKCYIWLDANDKPNNNAVTFTFLEIGPSESGKADITVIDGQGPAAKKFVQIDEFTLDTNTSSIIRNTTSDGKSYYYSAIVIKSTIPSSVTRPSDSFTRVTAKIGSTNYGPFREGGNFSAAGTQIILVSAEDNWPHAVFTSRTTNEYLTTSGAHPFSHYFWIPTATDKITQITVDTGQYFPAGTEFVIYAM